MSLLMTKNVGNVIFKLTKNYTWDEYRVHVIVDGAHIEARKYFTDGLDDAKGTMKAWLTKNEKIRAYIGVIH